MDIRDDACENNDHHCTSASTCTPHILHIQVRDWIGEIPDVCHDSYKLEGLQQRFLIIMDRYQEQPHLLDSFIPEMLSKLVILLRSDRPDVRHAAAFFAAVVFKVRKAKVVVKQLPHEVQDVEPVLTLLEKEKPHDYKYWYGYFARY